MNARSTQSGIFVENPFAVRCHTLQLSQHRAAKAKYKPHLKQSRWHLRNRKCTMNHETKENKKRNNFCRQNRKKQNEKVYAYNTHVQFYSQPLVKLSSSTKLLLIQFNYSPRHSCFQETFETRIIISHHWLVVTLSNLRGHHALLNIPQRRFWRSSAQEKHSFSLQKSSCHLRDWQQSMSVLLVSKSPRNEPYWTLPIARPIALGARTPQRSGCTVEKINENYDLFVQ